MALNLKLKAVIAAAALAAARLLLFETGRSAGLHSDKWNLEHPEWKSAENQLTRGTEDLIRREVDNPQWVRQAWSKIASTLLNGEEADEIAVHFESEGGQLQRRVIEWYVGELTLQTYTFTDRLKYGVPGSEAEMEDLRKTTYEIRSHFDPIYDLTKYPNAMRFASREPGVKYFKMMVMQGVHAVHLHLEKAANQARQTIKLREALIAEHVARALAGRRDGR
mgnify:CR=1 FL=1